MSVKGFNLLFPVLLLFGLVGILGFLSAPASAHCDTLDGPVVADARAALGERDVTPILKWIKPEDETQIREAFDTTLAVRSLSPEARDMADMYFFETLVRIHRAGEGQPYTGLKGPQAEVDEAVLSADRALASGSVDDLVKSVTDAVAQGIRARFAEAAEKREHVNDSLEAGREFVEAYVMFTHYVERIHQDAVATDPHHGEETHPVHPPVEGHHPPSPPPPDDAHSQHEGEAHAPAHH